VTLRRYRCHIRHDATEPLAEDVLQATFVRAWQALESGTQVRDLRPWLYRIAHNQAVNALRAAGPPESELPEELAGSVAAPDVAAERGEELRSALRGIGDLPDRQREALMAVAVEDRPHADVAAELGLSDGALRQLLLRARTALRAAATAITPYPLVSWLSAGSDVGAARVAEVAAGAGGIGVAVKAGAAVLATGALVVGAPALRDEHVARVTESTSTPAQISTAKLVAGDDRGSTAVEPGDDRRESSSGHGGPGPSSHRGKGSDDDDAGSGRSGRSGPGSGDGGGERSDSGGSDDAEHGGPGPSAPEVIRPQRDGGDDLGESGEDRRSGGGERFSGSGEDSRSGGGDRSGSGGDD
jgi:RNA polymerase sigma factor (sigma-70 family)